MRIGMAIGRASAMNASWTTVALVQAALRRGWSVRLIEPWDWQIESGKMVARAHAIDTYGSADEIASILAHRMADRRFVNVDALDLLMLRTAPWDRDVMSFAQMASGRGVNVVNNPAGLMQVSHKGWLGSLKDVPTPATLVTRSRATAHLFAAEQSHGVVIKPARGSGGYAVSLVQQEDDAGLDTAFDIARGVNAGYVVVQAYLPAADDGEKRLLWLDGQVIGGYLRKRAPGEFRHNLKHGADPLPTEVTHLEHKAVAKLTPALLKLGIRLAGLDVIGAQIIEVNALNPGGTYHADRLHGTQLSDIILDRLTKPIDVQRTPWALPDPSPKNKL